VRARRSAGFTLIEVLVALVIVVLGMSALLAALSSSANNIAALRDKAVAEWIALNQIELARLTLNPPGIGTTEGDVDDCGNGNWHWRQQVVPVDAVPGLLSITVSVQRTGDAHNAGLARPAPGSSPGATSPLAPVRPLGPTAPLGSVSTLSVAGCASAVVAGNSLGAADELGSPGSLGAGSLGSSTSLAGPTSLGSTNALGNAGLGNKSGTTSDSSGSGKDSSASKGSPAHPWLATLTGFRGNALAGATGEGPNWGGSAFQSASGGNGLPNGLPGGTPGSGAPGGLSSGRGSLFNGTGGLK
jgi:general secretion pathway protein I